MDRSNTEIMKLERKDLVGTEHQKRYLLDTLTVKMNCPYCDTGVNFFDAAKIKIDDYDFNHLNLNFSCPHCANKMKYTVPLFHIGYGWHWDPIVTKVKPEAMG